jgi:hypothetical protein
MAGLEEVSRVAAPGLAAAAWVASLNITVQWSHSVDKRLAGQVEVSVWRGPAPGPVLVTEDLLDRVRLELAGGAEGRAVLAAAQGEEGEGATYRLQRVKRADRLPYWVNQALLKVDDDKLEQLRSNTNTTTTTTTTI